MKLSFEYKGTKISYHLIYKKTKAIAINITEEGIVNVVAPLGTSVQTVIDKVKGNAPWILNELYHAERRKQKDNVSEQYTYLGRNYGVEIIKSEDVEAITVKLIRGKFIIQTPTESAKEIKAAILKWYKDKVTIKIKERLKNYAELFQEVPNEITAQYDEDILFKFMQDEVFVNFTVGMLPVEIIDYMIVSGLCKLNYTAEQHEDTKKLKEILPDYEEREEWLEKNKANLLL